MDVYENNAPSENILDEQNKEERRQKAASIRESLTNAAKRNKEEEFDLPPPQIRSNQIKNAVEFLQDPTVAKSPDDRKRRFLKSKGLTEEEIDEAFRQVKIPVNEPPPVLSSQAPLSVPPTTYTPSPLVSVSSTTPVILQVPWKKITAVFVIFSGIGQVIFYLIKNFIFPLFWKKKKKKADKKLAKTQDEIKGHINTIAKCINGQKEEISKLINVIKFSITGEKFKKNEDENPIDLQKEIKDLEDIIPQATKPTVMDSNFSTNYPALQNDISILKSALNEACLPYASFESVSPKLGYSQREIKPDSTTKQNTLPWKAKSLNLQNKPNPDWLQNKTLSSSLHWIRSRETQQTNQPTPNTNSNPSSPQPNEQNNSIPIDSGGIAY